MVSNQPDMAISPTHPMWTLPDMAELYGEWAHVQEDRQCASQAYTDYHGADYRLEGRLALRMCAACAAERIVCRAIWRRWEQLANSPSRARRSSTGDTVSIGDECREAVYAR